MPKMLSFIFILASFATFGADSKSSVTADKPAAISSVSNDEKLNVLMKVPGVQEKYDACKKADPDTEKVSTCVWSALDENLKKQVLAEYEKLNKTSDDKLDLSLNNTNIMHVTENSENNKGIENLKKTIEKKLRAVLYDEKAEKNKMTSVNHEKFHDIYKSEISKNIIDSTTNFCMSVDITKGPSPDAGCIKRVSTEQSCDTAATPEEKKKCSDNASMQCYLYTRNRNVETIRQENIDELNSKENNEVGKNISSCIASIPNICFNKLDANSSNDEKSLRNDACLVVDMLKASRKNLIVNDALRKVYDDQLVTKSVAVEVVNAKVKNYKNEEVSNAITVTSTEVEDAYKDENLKLAKEAEDCAKTPDQEKCNKFLDSNAKSKEGSLAEVIMRQNAQEAIMDKNLSTNNKEAIKEYLLKLGYDKDKIEDILKNDQSINEIKDSIKQKFKSQKESIIAELSERIKKTTKDETTPTKNIDRYKEIAQELSTKTDNLKSMVRFNNIASSYLETVVSGGTRNPASDKDGTSTAKRNTAYLNVELKADPKNKNNDPYKKIMDDKNNENGSSEFGIKTINEFLGLGY